MSQKVLRIHRADNVLIALIDLAKDEVIEFMDEYYALQNDIAAKHKFATTDLAVGDEIIMYGVLVGKATQPILKGELIHTHNIKHASNENYKKQKEYEWTAPDVSKWINRTFNGYLRN